MRRTAHPADNGRGRRPLRPVQDTEGKAIARCLQHSGEAAVDLDVGAVDVIGSLGGEENDGAH